MWGEVLPEDTLKGFPSLVDARNGLGEPRGYLEVEVVGNMSGLQIEQPAHVNRIGSGGRI